MFLLSMFIAPIAAIIPAAATSAALIYVGILMLGNLKSIDFSDRTQLVPVCFMLLAMPVSGSIGHGIGLALITYTIMKVVTSKAKEVSEDEADDIEKDIQKLTDKYIAEVDKAIEAKSKEVMTV